MLRAHTAAAVIIGFAVAGCGGAPAGPEDAAVPGAATSGAAAPGASGAPTSGAGQVLIGAQPVPDTPVAALPAHAGHTPLLESPSPPAPPADPPTPKPTAEWFVSVTGNDSAAGSDAAPFRTITKALTVAKPGAVIHVRAGTYAERVVIDSSVQPGRADARITLQGEGKPKLVPGGSGAGGIVQLRQPYWVVDGFEVDVRGQPEFGAELSGDVRGSSLANCELHHGTLGGGVTTHSGATGATIENNHIHHFSRGSADSHGIVVQASSKDITLRRNDIHDNSGDGVQCLGPEGMNTKPPADGLLLENNHLYSNRENGVDVKTCSRVIIRNNRIHGFRPTTTAKGDAIVVHMSASDVTIEGNDIFDASKGISIGGNHTGPVPTNVLVQKNRIHDIVRAGGGEATGIRLENSSGAKVLNNTLTRIEGTALMVGYGTGGPTTNLTVLNNIVAGAKAVELGAYRPGLKMDRNLYGPGRGAFEIEGANLDFAAWKTRGLDALSTESDPAFQPGDALVPSSAAAADKGVDVGLPFCGTAPDVGAVETGC